MSCVEVVKSFQVLELYALFYFRVLEYVGKTHFTSFQKYCYLSIKRSFTVCFIWLIDVAGVSLSLTDRLSFGPWHDVVNKMSVKRYKNICPVT